MPLRLRNIIGEEVSGYFCLTQIGDFFPPRNGEFCPALTPQRRFQKKLDLGNKYLAAMDYEKAVATFEAAIKIDPNNADAYVGLAKAYMNIGETEKANVAFQMALSLRPGIDDEYSKLIDEIQPNEKDGALAKAGNSQADDKDLGQFEERMDGSNSEKKVEEDPYQIYAGYLNAGNFDKGFTYYQSQLQNNPKDSMAYCFGAALYLMKDDAIGALTVLETGIAAGADRDILLGKEDYVRKNTTPIVTHETSTINYGSEDQVENYSIFYDENGRKIKRENNNGEKQIWEYDNKGQLIHWLYHHVVEDSDMDIPMENWDDEEFYKYNEKGDMIYQKINGAFTSEEIYLEYEYDRTGLIMHKIEKSLFYGSQKKYDYEYDKNGKLIHVRCDYGNNHIENQYYTYNEQGQCSSQTDAGGHAQYFKYDERGNLIEDKGDWTTYKTYYDLMNQPIKVEWNYGKTSHENTYHFMGACDYLLQ